MSKNIITTILSIIFINTYAQKNVNIPLAPDFKIITSTHDTLHLYEALDEGKTVVLDLFQVTCGPCLSNTPIIDSAFLLYNNQNDVVFWGISNADSNNTINQFITTYNVHFPCAGIEGLGDSVINLLNVQMGTFGFPTYAVICPTDKTMHWNINHPATIHGFDQAITTCTTTNILDNNTKTTGNEKVKIYPNPTVDFVNVEIKLEHNANLTCDLLSSMGEKIGSQEYLNVQNGISKFIITLDGMREGNYYLTIYEEGNLVFAGMIMKVKNK